MPSFPFRSFLCAAALAAVIPTHAGEMPRELKLLSQPKVAMLCTLQMTNLAILAQRDPVGAAHEAVQQSATFYTLALAWLPRAQAVSLEEQNRLGHLVVEQSVQDQMEQGEFCAEQAHQILDSLGPASKAAAVANGMSRAARLLRELQAG